MISIKNNKEYNKYIDNISKYIYKELLKNNIKSEIVNEFDNVYNSIKVYNDKQNYNLEKYFNNNYKYYLKISNDGNLEEVIYDIDLDNINNDWISLSNNIVEEIKNNFYLEEDRQVIKTYKVKKGDNLYSIAAKFNTSVDTLKTINNLTNNDLELGRILLIEPPFNIGEEITTYTVMDNETLEDIAKKFNTSPERIKELNNLQNMNVSNGEILVIPISLEKTNNLLYIVKQGDSLYSIAKKFDISVNELKKLNNLSSNLLKIGKELIVGINDSDVINYIVKDEDNIYSIANMYGVLIEDIKKLNNLTSNKIEANTVLKIPKE